MRPVRGLQSHSEKLPGCDRPPLRDGVERQIPHALGRGMLQGGTRISQVGNSGLKAQGEETQFGCSTLSCNVHWEPYLQPREDEKPPANATRAELVLPLSWAGALAASAPPQAAREGMHPPSPSHSHVHTHLILPSVTRRPQPLECFQWSLLLFLFLEHMIKICSSPCWLVDRAPQLLLLERQFQSVHWQERIRVSAKMYSIWPVLS